MKFNRKVSREVQELLTQQLREYEKNTPMSKTERRELRKWVAAGRSPYDNGDYIYGDNGCPLDFISSLRFEEELQERFNILTEEEQEQERQNLCITYDTEIGMPILNISQFGALFDTEEELPFQ